MVRKAFLVFALVVPAGVIALAQIWEALWWAMAGVGPLLVIGFHDILQRKHALLRVYPIIGHGRYLMEALRPEMQQYFVESNTDGTPFSREIRSVVYQRAKGVLDTIPFGTQQEVNAEGYEWTSHSILPARPPEEEPRVKVGGPECKQPYLASHLNVSAMSYGSLSRNAVLALNLGAKMGGFAHNTGEGGISPYHLEHGGDLIWQIGTGYFGCRAANGGFDPGRYAENASRPEVKMIELKISQGAKPGHGGILPAQKVTKEIAEIRGVPMGQDIVSPPGHVAFSTPRGLLEFIAQLRELSGGKPVGFKLCIGYRHEFLSICKAMLETQIYPDFISIDGGEGGTGAAPLELTNSVGTPLGDGLIFAHRALRATGLRGHMLLNASGKVSTGFHMFRAVALGADMCGSARGMMFALGCIQARRCNDNHCPVGVATQDPWRVAGLVVSDKAQRVANFHRGTVRAFIELYAAAGLEGPEAITPDLVNIRTDEVEVRTLADLYPECPEGMLLDGTAPEPWRSDWLLASGDRFRP